MSDPINPDHYAGRACADIGERLSANGFQILKYCWRLTRKDEAIVELGKAGWYADSERKLLIAFERVYPGMHTQALTQDLLDPMGFMEARIADQPPFTQTIARALWAGYNARKLEHIIAAIETERGRHASS